MSTKADKNNCAGYWWQENGWKLLLSILVWITVLILVCVWECRLIPYLNVVMPRRYSPLNTRPGRADSSSSPCGSNHAAPTEDEEIVSTSSLSSAEAGEFRTREDDGKVTEL